MRIYVKNSLLLENTWDFGKMVVSRATYMLPVDRKKFGIVSKLYVAGVVHRLECLLAKENVVGSTPIARSRVRHVV